jgi:hypothetical protein
MLGRKRGYDLLDSHKVSAQLSSALSYNEILGSEMLGQVLYFAGQGHSLALSGQAGMRHPSCFISTKVSAYFKYASQLAI